MIPATTFSAAPRGWHHVVIAPYYGTYVLEEFV